MVDVVKAGRVLSFPATTCTPASESPAESWSRRILEIVEFLRIAHNEMLAGNGVKEADEILAQVEVILKSDVKNKCLHSCCDHKSIWAAFAGGRTNASAPLPHPLLKQSL